MRASTRLRVDSLAGPLPAGVERLYAAEIALESVPEALGRLTRLRTLDLGHNLLSSLPDSLAAQTLPPSQDRSRTE